MPGLLEQHKANLAVFELLVPLKRTEDGFSGDVICQLGGEVILVEAGNKPGSFLRGKAGVFN